MPKPKIQLKQLERQIHEGTFLVGEQYFREGRVEQLRELDKGLWQARVRLEMIYDIEVLLRGDRVHAFTCPCSRGLKRLPCPHLIAVLLMMRNFRDQQRENKRVQKEATLPALQLRTLLQRVSVEDLQQFTKEWAKEDPSFAQAFKARFFAQISTTNPAHYLDLLLHSYQDADGEISTEQKHIQELLPLFRQVLAQVNSLLDQKQEESAYAILHHLLKTASTIGSDRLSSAILDGIITMMETQGLSAELHADDLRFPFLSELLNVLVAQGVEEGVHRNLLQIQAYSGFPESRSNILQVIKSLMSQSKMLQIDPEPLVLVYYQNLPDTDRQRDWLDDLQLPRMGPAFYERLVTTLLETGDFEGCERILTTGQMAYPESAELIRLRIQLYWELHDIDPLIDLAERLILNTLSNADVLFSEKYLSKKQLSILFKGLILKLEDGQTYDHHRLTCMIMARSGAWKAVARRVTSSSSIRLLDIYADDLNEQFPIEYQRILTQFLDDYLDQHVGPQAKQIVQKIRSLLSRQNLSALFYELAVHIKNRYPHRQSLLDDLDATPSLRI